MSKHFFFQHYSTMAVAAAVVVSIIAVATITTGWDQGWQITTALASMVAGFVYFIQKQRLEDVKLFHELFTDFNKRYDDLNGTLNAIVEEGDAAELTPEQRKTLNDYFNLCGEEFFYFEKDCIYPEVWQAWNKGMRWFYDNSNRIRRLWEKELRENAYYGFSLDHLRPSNTERPEHRGRDTTEEPTLAEASE